jgi:polar amino acid transport system substrate-binding protein
MILKGNEPNLGILIKYDTEKPVKRIIELKKKGGSSPGPLGIGFIGTGSFAQNILLPEVGKFKELIAVADVKGNIARNVADKFGFRYCSGNADDIFNDEKINTVFIATPHNLHAEYVLRAIGNDKNVYVEKPLCMTQEELNKIEEEYKKRNIHLMVGFNRRFSPHIQILKEILTEKSAKGITYRINAGIVPSHHWIHDKDIGGGRIIGEVCHFIDLAMFIAGSRITHLSAMGMDTSDNLEDTLVVNLGFENGSIASISYFSNGNKNLKKEYLEVFSQGQVAVIDDFKRMKIYANSVKKINLQKQDKGHSEEVKRFLLSGEQGLPTPISFEDIYASTFATFKTIESLRTKKTVHFS